jgi:hypothetical protein
MSSPEAILRQQLVDYLPASLPFTEQSTIAENNRFRVRLAMSDEERRSLYRLRFLIFNLEMNEGLDQA